jgi:hypothetical protein
MKEEYDEFDINENYLSECCESPILGPVTEGFGICSTCREWSEVKPNPEIENNA